MAAGAGSDYLVRRLRLRHLELLVVLADVGTMRAAATRLSLSQPAISKMLGELEAGFGGRLFERTPQGMLLNGCGAAAVHRARVMLSELGRAREEVDALRAGVSAVLRVGAPSVTAAVPAAIVRLRRELPSCSVHIREGRVSELLQRLLDGELDCVFGAITPELLSGDLLPHLQSEALLDDELCVLAASAHPLLRRKGLRWEALAEARWVAPPKETLVRQAFMTAFLNAGVTPPEPVIEVMSSVTLSAVLRMDPGVLCAVRLEHARDELARGGVRRLAVAPPVRLPAMGLFTRRSEMPQTDIVRAFAAAIKATGARSKARLARPA